MPAISNRLPGLNFDLGETADMLRAQVESFAATEIAPRAAATDRDNNFPMDLWRKLGALGLLGITAEEEYGGAGMGYLEHVVAMEEISRASASVGLSYGAHSQLCVNQTRRHGTRGAEAALSAAPDLRRVRRRAGHVGARRRIGRGRHADTGRKTRRSLHSERQQDVDHQRAGRRPGGGLRENRPAGWTARHHGIPGGEGVQGLLHRAEARQARHAWIQHLRAGVHGLRGAGRKCARAA